MAELNKLPKLEQLELVEAISRITPDRLNSGHDEIGAIAREGKVFYRLRKGDFRIYFEVRDNTLFCNHILHRHSVADFVFRMKLPLTEEQEIEQEQSFWKYLESLKK